MSTPIVFIHGSGGSSANWQSQTDYFGPQQAIAIDLPGHGQRPDTLPTEVAVTDYVRVVHDIITHELRLDHPIIAGHSLGGAIALSAALTGHLVLTTLHTTTAAGTIPRLLDMGAEPFVIASAVSMFVSQRLIRVL